MLSLRFIIYTLLTVLVKGTAIPDDLVGKTNTARFARGLGPAMPKPLEKSIARGHSGQLPEKRAVCPSARPPFFPQHPNMDNETVIINRDNVGTGFVELPFMVKLFNYESNRLFMTLDGMLTLDFVGRVSRPIPLPANDKSAYSIFAYWARYDWTDSFAQVSYQLYPDAIAVRYQGTVLASPPETGAGEIYFVVYYTTQYPNWWFIYYDGEEGEAGTGSKATIGVQGLGNFDQNPPNQYTQFIHDISGAVYGGPRLPFDTSCPDRWYTA